MSERPKPGQLYAFRTNARTKRHGVFKIIGVNPDTIAVAVLDGVWAQPPSAEEARERGVLAEHRFSFAGRPAMFGMSTTWWSPKELPDQTLLGEADISAVEAEAAHRILHVRVGCSYHPLTGAGHSVDAEWRWANDRDAFIAEIERETADREAARVAKAERYQTRLKGLTWERWLSENPLARWSPSPPFPPPEFTNAVRMRLLEAGRSLQSLGPKPRKAQVRTVLKDCVHWLNEADAQGGEVIETEEREDLYEALEELAFVAGHPSLIEDIEAWRTW